MKPVRCVLAATLMIALSAVSVFATATGIDDDGPVELKMYSWAGAGPEYDRNVAFIEWYEAANPGVTVAHEVPQGNFHQALFTDFAAGIEPDVFYMGGRELEQYHDLGVVANLTDFLATDPKVDSSDILEVPLDYFRLNMDPNADIYALSIGWTTYLLFYNKAMFEDRGIQTPDQLYAAGQWDSAAFLDIVNRMVADTDNDGSPDEFGFEIPPWYTNMFQFIGANGGVPFMDGDRVTYDDDASIEVYELVHKLRWDDHTIPQPGDIEGWAAFPTGTIAMELSGNWEVARLNALEADWEWGLTMIPAFEQYYTNLYSNGIAMSPRTPHPEEAWDFIREFALGRGAEMTAERNISFPLSRRAYESMNAAAIWEESLRYAEPVPRHAKISEVQNIVVKYHAAYMDDPESNIDDFVDGIMTETAEILGGE